MVKLFAFAVTLLVQAFCVSSGAANQTRSLYGGLSYSDYGQVPNYGLVSNFGPVPSYGQSYQSSYQKPMDGRQPMIILGPHATSINLIDYYLKEYANSIEMDIQFDPETGHILYVGTVEQSNCDCGNGCLQQNSIDRYLRYINQLTKIGSPKYNPQLIALYTVPMGITDSTAEVKEEAGRQLFLVINKYLYENGNPQVYIYLINGIGHLSFEPYVHGFESAKRQMGLESFYHKVQGWDFWSTNHPESAIVAMWQRQGLFHGPSSNLWQSNGRSICENSCEPPMNATDVARALAAKKYIVEIKKVQIWTVVAPQDIMFLLDHGVDSVETSEPELVWNMINSPPYNQCYRLATWADSPWTQVNPQPACNKPLESYGSDYSSNYAMQGPSYGSPSQYQSYGNPSNYGSYGNPSYGSDMPSYSEGYAGASPYSGGYSD